MTELVTGWTFTDQATLDWQEFGTGVAMKTLGGPNGRAIALFKFDAGYVGSPHEHTDAEFSYILEGDLISNGVTMTTGHAYGGRSRYHPRGVSNRRRCHARFGLRVAHLANT